MPRRYKVAFIVPNNPYLITPKVHPPLGVMYLAAVLKGHHEVEVLDMAGVKRQSKLIMDIDADYACISATTPQFSDACSIKEQLPVDCLSVIGGVHVTHKPFDGELFDFIVMGEGEKAIIAIVGKPLARGRYRFNEISDIDTIPFPDRSIVDIHSYKYYIDDIPATTMITSRGCPYACAFCSTIWRKVRYHSAKYVLKELDEVQSKYGFNAVHFFDDIFTLKHERLKAICNGLRERKMIWRCFISGGTVTEQQLSLMAKSGCKEVAIGIESGSAAILHTVNKSSTIEANKNAVTMAHKAGIRVKGLFIVGLPGESHETVAETEAFINECPCDDYDFSILSVLPNSDIYVNKAKYNLSVSNASAYKDMWYKGTPGMYHSLVSTSHLTAAEITDIRDKLERKYKPEGKLK